MEAAGKTSCFARSGKCLPDPASFKLFQSFMSYVG
jgi:hypothetical protein